MLPKEQENLDEFEHIQVQILRQQIQINENLKQ